MEILEQSYVHAKELVRLIEEQREKTAEEEREKALQEVTSNIMTQLFNEYGMGIERGVVTEACKNALEEYNGSTIAMLICGYSRYDSSNKTIAFVLFDGVSFRVTQDKINKPIQSGVLKQIPF